MTDRSPTPRTIAIGTAMAAALSVVALVGYAVGRFVVWFL
jgi:hypothetical protein